MDLLERAGHASPFGEIDDCHATVSLAENITHFPPVVKIMKFYAALVA